MKLKISVTQNHIEESIPSTKCHCPIALAIVDALEAKGCVKGYNHASVDHDGGRITAGVKDDTKTKQVKYKFTRHRQFG